MAWKDSSFWAMFLLVTYLEEANGHGIKEKDFVDWDLVGNFVTDGRLDLGMLKQRYDKGRSR